MTVKEKLYLPAQEAAHVADAPPKALADSRHDGRRQEGQQVACRVVRRTLQVPSKFREHLAGTDEWFLKYFRGHHSVLIFMNVVKKRIHIKGAQKNAQDCFNAAKALLSEWMRRHAATIH